MPTRRNTPKGGNKIARRISRISESCVRIELGSVPRSFGLFDPALRLLSVVRGSNYSLLLPLLTTEEGSLVCHKGVEY